MLETKNFKTQVETRDILLKSKIADIESEIDQDI